MARTAPFDRYIDQYEQWFTDYEPIYRSELAALAQVIRPELRALEVGVGSGLFAEPLGIPRGLEPSEVMAERARRRGIQVDQGTAEELPYGDGSFELTLMVTTICFVDDPAATVRELFRVLQPGGRAIMGFVDQDSPLGRVYEEFKEENVFYRDATFYGTEEVATLLRQAGFEILSVRQTVFGMLDEIDRIQGVRAGHGDGGFVVVEAVKP